MHELCTQQDRVVRRSAASRESTSSVFAKRRSQQQPRRHEGVGVARCLRRMRSKIDASSAGLHRFHCACVFATPVCVSSRWFATTANANACLKPDANADSTLNEGFDSNRSEHVGLRFVGLSSKASGWRGISTTNASDDERGSRSWTWTREGILTRWMNQYDATLSTAFAFAADVVEFVNCDEVTSPSRSRSSTLG